MDIASSFSLAWLSAHLTSLDKCLFYFLLQIIVFNNSLSIVLNLVRQCKGKTRAVSFISISEHVFVLFSVLPELVMY